MDDLIPSADELLKTKRADDERDAVDKFLKDTLRIVAAHLRENAVRLSEGMSATFVFPVYRDMGKRKHMWEKYYTKVMQILQDKGYTVSVVNLLGDTALMILIERDEAP